MNRGMVVCGTTMSSNGMEGPESFLHFFDVRCTTQPLSSFRESHSDDITSVHFSPFNPNYVLSGAEDSLCCVFDIAGALIQDEEEALQMVGNAEASINQCGWYGESTHADYIWATTRIESLSIWTRQDVIRSYCYIQPLLNV